MTDGRTVSDWTGQYAAGSFLHTSDETKSEPSQIISRQRPALQAREETTNGSKRGDKELTEPDHLESCDSIQARA